MREYAQQDAQGNTTSVLMPTLGSDLLPTVIDGESVHLTGTATDGYTATLADGSVLSSTPKASDPAMQDFALRHSVSTATLLRRF